MSTNRPNILLITTDQQRYDTINAAGNPHILTPNLNWLLDQGVHFRNAYSECPVCMPARTTIMTGKHGYSTGLVDNVDGVDPIDPATSLPGILTQAGYQTRIIGKMHLPAFRRNYGFEHIEPCDDYYRFMARHPNLGTPLSHGLGQNQMEPAISTVSETNSLTGWVADRSVTFLETRDASRPFFLWTSFTKPHPPLDPVLSYWTLYQNRSVPEPVYGDWSRLPEDVPEGFMRFIRTLNGCDRFSPEMLTDVRRAYYACITQIDYNLGLVFSRLRELGELENTWIIFTSDHGEMLGDHHLAAKFLALEASAKVPFLVRPPAGSEWGSRRGTTRDELVTMADILPTLAGFAGVSHGQTGIDGLDLTAVVRGDQPGRTEIRFESAGLHGLRRGNTKYLASEATGEELLFDLEADPLEQHDLSAEAPDLLTETRSRLRRLLSDSGHPFAQRIGELVPVADRPPATRGEWPGHHSIHVPTDVLH